MGWTLSIAAVMALGTAPPANAQSPAPNSAPASSRAQASATTPSSAAKSTP
jgi:hypothetical protein